MMKMVMVVYNEIMDMEVMEALDNCGAKNYTKVTGALGTGVTSGTHLGNDIWPGKNNILYAACDSAAADKLFSCAGELRKKLGREGIKAFSWELDRVTE